MMIRPMAGLFLPAGPDLFSTFGSKEMVSSYLTVLPGTDGAYKYEVAQTAILKTFVG